MPSGKKILLVIMLLAICIGCDQATKHLASETLKGSEPLVFLSGMLRLEYAENSGAFLSLGATLPDWHRWLLLHVITSVMLAVLAIFIGFRRDLSALEVTGYSLILAGGISNMIDRIAAGSVVDFMNIGLGSLRTGIFNAADVFIMAGLFAIIISRRNEIIPKKSPA